MYVCATSANAWMCLLPNTTHNFVVVAMFSVAEGRFGMCYTRPTFVSHYLLFLLIYKFLFDLRFRIAWGVAVLFARVLVYWGASVASLLLVRGAAMVKANLEVDRPGLPDPDHGYERG